MGREGQGGAGSVRAGRGNLLAPLLSPAHLPTLSNRPPPPGRQSIRCMFAGWRGAWQILALAALCKRLHCQLSLEANQESRTAVCSCVGIKSQKKWVDACLEISLKRVGLLWEDFKC